METKIERFETDHAITVNATIIHEGHECTANGGYLSPELVYAYVKPTPGRTYGNLTLWDGTCVGHYETVSTWHRYGNRLGRYTMRSIVAWIDSTPAKGRFYGRFNESWGELVTLRPYN